VLKHAGDTTTALHKTLDFSRRSEFFSRHRQARPEKISTSYVERFNLSSRMQMRRFIRLTNGFSKKLQNHRAAVALWIRFYNLCRVHETLRCTPAMALGVTDHVWTTGELVAASLESDTPPPLPRPTSDMTLRPAPPRLRLIVGRGGKGANKPR
jgi:hypothetical protein